MKKRFYILSIINIILEVLLVISAIESGSLFGTLLSSGIAMPLIFIVMGYFIGSWFIKSETKTPLGIVLFVLCVPSALISLIAVFIIMAVLTALAKGGSSSSGSNTSDDADEYTGYFIDNSSASATIIRTKTGGYVTEVDYVNSDGDYVGKNGSIYHIDD